MRAILFRNRWGNAHAAGERIVGGVALVTVADPARLRAQESDDAGIRHARHCEGGCHPKQESGPGDYRHPP